MNGACIVETRPIENLVEIIKERHLKFLPDDWGLTLYLSSANLHLINGIDFGRQTDVFTLPNRFGEYRYNQLLKSFKFWDSLPYEKVLIFQTDSRLLREGVEAFLEFDYVGAPWKFQQHGGNGGLSLRDVNIMKHIVTHNRFTPRNEDVLICNIMHGHKIGNLAPREICNQFSTEAIYQLETLGCHAIETWLSPEECEQILTQYE